MQHPRRFAQDKVEPLHALSFDPAESDDSINADVQGSRSHELTDRRLAEFCRVAEHSRDQLRRLAVRIVGPCDEADDIVQQALLKAFINLSRFRGDSQLTTWLGAIVRNVALERIRTQRSKPVLSLEHPLFGDGDSEVRELPGSSLSPEELYSYQEQWKLLSEVLAQMSRTSQQIFDMCVFEDHSQLEVAASLNLSLSKVKSRMFRIRRAFRRETLKRQQSAGCASSNCTQSKQYKSPLDGVLPC